jgi:hypothetical protein
METYHYWIEPYWDPRGIYWNSNVKSLDCLHRWFRDGFSTKELAEKAAQDYITYKNL